MPSWAGDDHEPFRRVAHRRGPSLPPELGSERTDDRVELVLRGAGVPEARDQGPERPVDLPPGRRDLLALGREPEDAEGGEGIDLEGLEAHRAEGGSDPGAS